MRQLLPRVKCIVYQTVKTIYIQLKALFKLICYFALAKLKDVKWGEIATSGPFPEIGVFS